MKRKATRRKKEAQDARPEPLAMFPDAVPRGYVKVREHLRRLTGKKRKR